MQLQASRKKHNKLEFLVPWWDFAAQHLRQPVPLHLRRQEHRLQEQSISFLLADGANEELSSLQAMEAHVLPHHFANMKKKLGLALAAIVSARGSNCSVLKSVDANKPVRSNYPMTAAKKFSGEKDENLAAHGHGGNSMMKENNNPDVDGYISNPYLSIAMARDSLRQREEAKKKQAELTELENKATEMQQKNEEERVAFQDLEAQLIKMRR